MGDAWMKSDLVRRCESCGLRLEDPTNALCPSCTYRKKKAEQKADAAAKAAPPSDEGAAPAPAPDVDALRERLRRVQETLKEDRSG